MSSPQQRWTAEAVRQGRRLALFQTRRVIYQQGKMLYPSRQMSRETAIKFFQAMLGFPPWAAAVAADEYARVWREKPKPNPTDDVPAHIEVVVPGEGIVYSGRDDIRAMTVYGHYVKRGREAIVYVDGEEWERYVPDPKEELEVARLSMALKQLSKAPQSNPAHPVEQVPNSNDLRYRGQIIHMRYEQAPYGRTSFWHAYVDGELVGHSPSGEHGYSSAAASALMAVDRKLDGAPAHMSKNPKASKQITVVIKRVGQAAKIGTIASTLEGWHDALGGDVMVQLVPFHPGGLRSIELAFDEDGIAKGLPLNVVHPYWGPILGNLFVQKRGKWKPGEAEAIAQQLNVMPQNRAMNPRNPVSSWPIYEYKIAYVKRTATVPVQGRAPFIVQAGEYLIFEAVKQPASETFVSQAKAISQAGPQGTTPFFDARDMARAKSKTLDPRNPHAVRVLDTTGRCVAAFLHGEEASCETAAAENPVSKGRGLLIAGAGLVTGIVLYLFMKAQETPAT